MDWQNSTWAKDKLSGSVPDSCCKVYSANCGEIVADTSINPAIYTEGCLPKFVHYVQSNGSTFAGVALGLSLVQVSFHQKMNNFESIWIKAIFIN